MLRLKNHFRLSLREFPSYNKHTNHKPSRPSTGFYPWKSYKRFFLRLKLYTAKINFILVVVVVVVVVVVAQLKLSSVRHDFSLKQQIILTRVC